MHNTARPLPVRRLFGAINSHCFHRMVLEPQSRREAIDAWFMQESYHRRIRQQYPVLGATRQLPKPREMANCEVAVPDWFQNGNNEPKPQKFNYWLSFSCYA